MLSKSLKMSLHSVVLFWGKGIITCRTSGLLLISFSTASHLSGFSISSNKKNQTSKRTNGSKDVELIGQHKTPANFRGKRFFKQRQKQAVPPPPPPKKEKKLAHVLCCPIKIRLLFNLSCVWILFPTKPGLCFKVWMGGGEGGESH